jgi:Kef-type K+ transport system membrane component KefB
MFDIDLQFLSKLPLLARFALTLTIVLTVPALCKRIRLPAVAGFVIAGIVFGTHGLDVGPKDHAVAYFFSEVGKLLLMFFAGLEIDLRQFHSTRGRSLAFGSVTFGMPLAVGVAVGVAFGYGWIGALLIGSLLASHTLLGYPIVERLGLVRTEPVTVTIGATIFTDIAALLVLAICIPIHTSGFSMSGFILQIVQLAIYVPLVLFGLSSAVGFLIGKLKTSKEGQFLVLLLAVAVAGIGADAINLEGIIGAFLAGLALNRAIQQSAAKAELEFLGNTLFIPMFFITIGFLIDVQVFMQTIVSHLGLVLSIVGGLIGAKLAAAFSVRKSFGYTHNETLLMWSLSLPQVAATLAAALVAFDAKNNQGQRLIDEPVLNTIIVLMLVTSILGPILTEFFGKGIVAKFSTAAKSETESLVPG